MTDWRGDRHEPDPDEWRGEEHPDPHQRAWGEALENVRRQLERMPSRYELR